MGKITKLTPELEARLPVYREEMRQRGLRLQWASEGEIRSAVLDLYSAAGLAKPAVIVLDSPLACLAARHLAKGLGKDQLGDQLGDQLRGQLGDQLRGQLRGQLGGRLWGQLGGQLGGQLRDQLGGQLGDQLGGQLWGQLGDQLGEEKIEFQTLWFSGGAEHYWIAFYDFARIVGAKYPKDLDRWLGAWIRYADNCGCLYPYDGIAFVSRRPTRLAFNSDLVLHSETGAAMEFADGFALYVWNGVRVPKHWIAAPDKIDPQEILSAENVEQRAAGIAIIGMAKMLDRLDHKIIDSDPDPERGDLIQVNLKGLPEPGYYLRADCPRNGRIMEAVDHTQLDEMTVRGAQAWRLGIPASEFVYPTKRT